MMVDDLEARRERMNWAVSVAREASGLILTQFTSSDLQVEAKRDLTPVTVADRDAERLIRDRIESDFPGDGVLGEEYGEVLGTSGYRWILDPIDGTKSFIHGVPLFGTLIGLEHHGEMVAGVCRMPALEEVVYAAVGVGAYWQRGDEAPEPARVSSVDRLDEALLCTTTITGWRTIGLQSTFERLCGAAGLVRGWSDCYGHLLVATGRADVMVDPELNAWDAAPFLPILSEAGGHFLSFDGRETIDGGNGLSVNGEIKAEVLALISDPTGT